MVLISAPLQCLWPWLWMCGFPTSSCPVSRCDTVFSSHISLPFLGMGFSFTLSAPAVQFPRVSVSECLLWFWCPHPSDFKAFIPQGNLNLSDSIPLSSAVWLHRRSSVLTICPLTAIAVSELSNEIQQMQAFDCIFLLSPSLVVYVDLTEKCVSVTAQE